MLIAEEITRKPALLPLPENNAVGSAGRELRDKSETEFENAVMGSVFWSATIFRGKAKSKLIELAGLKSNWDTYGAPAPNEVALQNAIRILELMEPLDLSIANIIPSAEGGVGFCFVTGERYADVELSNDGEILGVRYVGMEAPVLIQTDGTDDSIRAALEQIRNHTRA